MKKVGNITAKKSKKYKITNDNIINIDYLYMYYSNKHNSQIC